MVRVFIKGGVWKNSEDEVLKAAVQKYGKQQWARVASLLNRKSAKQCKARWHEWLDPSVRKVEWSRAEEEKLLHLAKLLPAQWKTIAPLVGRTASQCQEHYEQLLDQAATAATGGDSADGTASSSAAAGLRQYTPGQIDSHPETKPARPDPIDMDEDEIEMLQEARARLANTQGKKAKRKAREKMLVQAKRLADLQKRRELKQAGLLSSQARQKARKRNRDIDLGVEIPFHKPAPAGFHDTTSEDARAEAIRQQRLKQVDLHKVNENIYRSRDREAAAQKKRDQARLRMLEQSNMQYVVAQVSKNNDPIAARKRGPLELPAPSVSDRELEKLAKATAQLDKDATATDDHDASATRALLGDYADRPLPTPMRTPATRPATTQESILNQASQLRRLAQGQTPLLAPGAVMEDEEEVSDHDEDQKLPAAPTPGRPDRTGQGGQTPARDQLGLHRRNIGDDAMSVGGSTFATSQRSIRELAREERRAAKRARLELEQALAALPAPQFEYELALPETVDEGEDDQGRTAVVLDAADVEAAELERLRKLTEKLYEARSSVVKRRDLPRPMGVIEESVVVTATDDAARLIQQEMLTLVRHDAHAFPVVSVDDGGMAGDDGEAGGKTSKKRKKRPQPGPVVTATEAVSLEYIPEEFLDMARDIVQQDLHQLLHNKTAEVVGSKKAVSEAESMDLLIAENTKAASQAVEGHVYVHDGWTVASSTETTVESYKLELAALDTATANLCKKNDKAEAKLALKYGGYSKRASKLRGDALQSFMDLQNVRIEEAVYRTLQAQEVSGGASRISKLQEEIAYLDEDEAVLQKRYSDLVLDKRRLMVQLQKQQASTPTRLVDQVIE